MQPGHANADSTLTRPSSTGIRLSIPRLSLAKLATPAAAWYSAEANWREHPQNRESTKGARIRCKCELGVIAPSFDQFDRPSRLSCTFGLIALRGKDLELL